MAADAEVLSPSAAMLMLPIVATVASMALLAVFATRHFASARAGAIAVALFASLPVVWLAARGGAPQIVLVPLIIAALLLFELFDRGERWRWLAVSSKTTPAILAPVVIVSLLLLDWFHRVGNWKWLVLAGATLAMMLYGHADGVLVAPLYLLVGVLILLPRRGRLRSVGALLAGFAVVFLFWMLGGHQAADEPITASWWYDANPFDRLQEMDISGWPGVTASRAVLLLFAVPLVLGLAGYLVHARDAIDRLVVAAFVAALAAALIAPPAAPRLILLAPTAALIATRGCFPVLARLALLRRRLLQRSR